jgi:hypothetical protein
MLGLSNAKRAELTRCGSFVRKMFPLRNNAPRKEAMKYKTLDTVVVKASARL